MDSGQHRLDPGGEPGSGGELAVHEHAAPVVVEEIVSQELGLSHRTTRDLASRALA